ncbi:MAG: hypothetical protein ACI915_002876, partial [Gammaproteobacteria bacterium]
MAFDDLINRQNSQTREHHECYGYFEQKLSRYHGANAPFPTHGLICLRAQFVARFVCNRDATGSRTKVEREREAQHQAGGSIVIESPTTRRSDDDLHLDGSDDTGGITRPIILIDWSDLDASKRHFLLRATLAMNGRYLTLYEEVHEVSTKEKPKTHRQYLRRLADIVGPDCRPIIVTDAGFKTPWFREVLALNWNFVGRSRKPNY